MFEFLQKLPNLEELKRLYPSSSAAEKWRKKVEDVIVGRDSRLLLVIGPCSMDSENTIYKYVEKLMSFSERVSDELVVVPRLYTSKPRSRSGFRGLIHSPNLTDSDMAGGIVLCRKILSGVLNRFGVGGADEILYPELFGYFDDLLAYAAVGARSSENQQHRMFASGLEMAVGFKNPLSGSVGSLVNSVLVARESNILVATNKSQGAVYKTTGNNLAHAVLRGYTDVHGTSISNAGLEYFEEFLKAQKNCGEQIPFLVDVSHDNSAKECRRQPEVLAVIAENLKNPNYKKLFRGVMIESYLVEGKNDETIMAGRSNTDACLSFEQTERAILDFLDKI